MQATKIFSHPNILRTISCSSAKNIPPKRFLFTTIATNDSFKVQDLDDFNQRVKNAKKPVIVDFFATWCNPCKALTPRLESVIAETNGKVDLAKVDIDEQSDLALEYDVGSVPVLLLIRNGKVEERLVGLQDVDKLRKFVDKVNTKF